MSTIKSSDEHLTLNADGSSKDIKFQANGVEKASISSAGAFTSTSIDATKLTGNLPAINGASLTNLPSATADGFFATSGLSSKDLGQGLHIKTGDSGLGSVNSNFGQLVIEGNTTAGISILTSTTHEGVLAFSDSGGHRGLVRYTHDSDKMSFATADVDRMFIDSNGYLTVPNQPSCSVSRSSGQGSGSIEWNYVNYNTGNHFSTSTHRFTAPIAGKYLVNLFGMSNSSNTTMDIEVRINGNGNNILVPYENANGATLHQVSGSNIFGLSANDYLTVHVNSGSWYGGTAGRHNGFSVHLLG